MGCDGFSLLIGILFLRKSLKSFAKAIQLDPNNDIAWTNLGGLLCNLKIYDDALKILEKALELNPNDPEILFNKGTVLNNLGKHEQSLAILNQVIELDPDFQEAWTNRGLALGNLGRYSEALKSFEQALQQEPNDEMALYSRGFVLANLGRYDEALASYNRVINLNQEDVEAWLGRGMTLSNLEEYDKALASFNKAIEIDSTNSRAWYGKSIILNELKNYEEALLACNKSIELGRQTADIFFNRAKVLLALNRWDEGIIVLDDAFRRLTHDASEPNSRDTGTIIHNLLFKTQETATWRSHIKALIDIYDKHQFTSLLGQELIQSIRKLFSSPFDIAMAALWRDIWQELARDLAAFQTPLRLLDAAVRYRQTKGDPFILQELSLEEQNLFLSLLGVEKSPNPLNEAELLWQAGYIALTAYTFFGRGVVLFNGEKPRYISRQENMPAKLLALVDEYEPEKEFIVILSDHLSVKVVDFADVGLEPEKGTESFSAEEYEQELETILAQLQEKGLNPVQVEHLRRMTLAHRDGEYSLAAYPSEMLKICQFLFEDLSAGNIDLFVDVCKRHFR
ncbi:MAG: tetratricopeptide repeat protein [Hydrococcus sp. Prado102]|jgi:tetratricopeptide (TPR) repeat protein|nr:tetratricopeptide repeat protein [Hydrococcus sp. Prado102]